MSGPGRLLRPKHVTRAEVQANSGTLYVFGDNVARRGLGGQAAAMRGELNAVGVPTKWWPGMAASAFFTDATRDDELVMSDIAMAFGRLEAAIKNGRDIAIPADGLGTGLAELPARAPLIHAYIEERIAYLAKLATP